MRDPKCKGGAVSSWGRRAAACATAAGAGLKPIAAEKIGGIRFKSESRRMSAGVLWKGKMNQGFIDCSESQVLPRIKRAARIT
jgi:hypothetical protein